MRFVRPALPLCLLLLAGCGNRAPEPAETATLAAAPTASVAAQDPLAADDHAQAVPDAEPRLMMQIQVVLDRLGFTPGVIDGASGLSTRNALAGFQEANGLPVTGNFDAPTREKLGQWAVVPATRVVTIPADFAAGPFIPVPARPAEQARLSSLGYASLEEKLAERFHTTPAVLRSLNPGGVPAGSGDAAPTEAVAQPPDSAKGSDSAAPTPVTAYRAGQQLRVPNIGNDKVDPATGGDADWQRSLVSLGVGTDQPQVERIVVSKSRGVLKGYDPAGKLVAVYTATMGSQHDPLPLGDWKVNGLARNPKFHFNPALFWDARPGDAKATLPPGPNGPVGVVWIDLSKPHYGIHGTPRPETIGRAESHGCVRLTNWDAARLALMVRPGTRVHFEQ
jgi:lipoprotein-anchoring transpeptidase ErfK/SrfK